jgi:hypothetical protein
MTHEDDYDNLTVTTTIHLFKSGLTRPTSDKNITTVSIDMVSTSFDIDDDRLTIDRRYNRSIVVALLIVTVVSMLNVQYLQYRCSITGCVVDVYYIVRLQYLSTVSMLSLSLDAVGYCDVLQYPILGEYLPNVTMFGLTCTFCG